MFDTLNTVLALLNGMGGKWVKGKVKTNVDPLNLDRIKAEVPGLYDPDLGDVPWIGPFKFSPFGFGNGWGVYGTPAVDSDVMIFLQDGNPQYPLYLGILTTKNDDFPSGTSWGFADPAGNRLRVQGKDVEFQTQVGFIFHVDESGNFTVTSPSGTTGTFNVPEAVWNVTDFTVNASNQVRFNATSTVVESIFDVVGNTNINGVTISSTGGNAIFPGTTLFNGLMTTGVGLDITGTGSLLVNGHNLGPNHTHTGGTLTGGLTGTVHT